MQLHNLNFFVGNGKAPDLKYVERAARDIAETVTEGNKIVVEKSTVPVKAAESIAIILSANKKPGVNYQVYPFLAPLLIRYNLSSLNREGLLNAGSELCIVGSIFDPVVFLG